MKLSMSTISRTTLMCGITVAFAGNLRAADTVLGATPQMGFNNWNSTHCRAEFDQKMIRGIADKFISLGLRDAGYRYVNIDDCWANWKRDGHGRLQANPQRFPGADPLARRPVEDAGDVGRKPHCLEHVLIVGRS